MKSLVLLDRDGTINVERHYLSSPNQVELLPGAAEGIRFMRCLGLTTIVVTNQSAIGRGYFDVETLDRIHQRLRRVLAARGASLDAIYVCPHSPEVGCRCRKPAPGLALRAAYEFGCDLSCSFVVGDRKSDMEMGNRIGATTLLIRNDHDLAVTTDARADFVVGNLLEAAHIIQALVSAGNKRETKE